MDDNFWSETEVARLHAQIGNELAAVFHHNPVRSQALTASWLAKHPAISPDFLSHEGPFNIALRVQYDLVELGDSFSPQFIDWRKSYAAAWGDKLKHNLTPAQEALLRSRGWDGS